MPLLEVRNLRKAYGDIVALRDVSFSIEKGDVFGLLGPNGAGKSTTMMIICGLLEPDSGVVLLDGRELGSDSRDLKRRLGVVPQDLAIYPELSARENLRFFGRLYGLSGSTLTERVSDALERIGLEARADTLASTYSGGMKRRLNFGCALLHQPDVLILDEPTVGVDPQSRNHLLKSVRELSKEGMTIIYASHYMEEVEEVCKRVAIIDQGEVIANDRIKVLLNRLKSEIVLHLRGGERTLPPELSRIATLDPERDGRWTVNIDRGKLNGEIALNEHLAHAMEDFARQGAVLETIETHESNLERLFLELTGSRLRD